MNMLNSAKKLQQLALKNKDKVAAGVNKATDVIDKKTGGKHTDKLKKLDAAAAKFAGKTESAETAETNERLQPGSAGDVTADPAIHPTPDPMPHPSPEG